MIRLLTKTLLALAVIVYSLFLLAPKAYAIDLRSVKLARFLEKYHSPLAPYSVNIVNQADKNGFDYRLLPAIAGVESTFGQNYVQGSYNLYGWGGGWIFFDSFEDGILKVSDGLKTGYLDAGAKDVEQISWIYCPPGNLSWAWKVRYFEEEIAKTDISDLVAGKTPQLQLPLTI